MAKKPILRSNKGTFLPGVSGNPEGGRALVAKRRLQCAIANQLEPPDYQEIAQALIRGMKDPESYPISAKLGYERVWPVRGPDDERSAGGSTEILSQDERARLSDVFGEEIGDGPIVDVSASVTRIKTGDAG